MPAVIKRKPAASAAPTENPPVPTDAPEATPATTVETLPPASEPEKAPESPVEAPAGAPTASEPAPAADAPAAPLDPSGRFRVKHHLGSHRPSPDREIVGTLEELGLAEAELERLVRVGALEPVAE